MCENKSDDPHTRVDFGLNSWRANTSLKLWIHLDSLTTKYITLVHAGKFISQNMDDFSHSPQNCVISVHELKRYV